MRIRNDFFKRMCGMRPSALLLLVSESPVCTGCALADCKQAAEEQQATRKRRITPTLGERICIFWTTLTGREKDKSREQRGLGRRST